MRETPLKRADKRVDYSRLSSNGYYTLYEVYDKGLVWFISKKSFIEEKDGDTLYLRHERSIFHRLSTFMYKKDGSDGWILKVSPLVGVILLLSMIMLILGVISGDFFVPVSVSLPIFILSIMHFCFILIGTHVPEPRNLFVFPNLLVEEEVADNPLLPPFPKKEKSWDKKTHVNHVRKTIGLYGHNLNFYDLHSVKEAVYLWNEYTEKFIKLEKAQKLYAETPVTDLLYPDIEGRVAELTDILEKALQEWKNSVETANHAYDLRKQEADHAESLRKTKEHDEYVLSILTDD